MCYPMCIKMNLFLITGGIRSNSVSYVVSTRGNFTVLNIEWLNTFFIYIHPYIHEHWNISSIIIREPMETNAFVKHDVVCNIQTH